MGHALSPLVVLGGGLILVVAGLDELYSWSPTFSLPVKILSLIFILVGYAISSYALVENRFFSGMMRIQAERGHRVDTTGPYAWIRHPGYSGALLLYLFTPLFLDSSWAFIPVFLLSFILVIRMRLEDATLQEELEGYADYARRVRFRLFPGVW